MKQRADDEAQGNKTMTVKMKILLLFTVCVLLCIMLHGILIKNGYEKRNTYANHYCKTVGIPRSLHTYGALVVRFGEPLRKIESSTGAITVCYEDFELMFWSDNETSTLMNVAIISSRLAFKNKKIHIGSTRAEVEKAYAKARKPPEQGCNYFDGNTFIEFEFDENDLVSRICFFHR